MKFLHETWVQAYLTIGLFVGIVLIINYSLKHGIVGKIGILGFIFFFLISLFITILFYPIFIIRITFSSIIEIKIRKRN